MSGRGAGDGKNGGSWQEAVRCWWVLEQEGEGEEWMRNIERERGEMVEGKEESGGEENGRKGGNREWVK